MAWSYRRDRGDEIYSDQNGPAVVDATKQSDVPGYPYPAVPGGGGGASDFNQLTGDFALTQTPSASASIIVGRGAAGGAGDWQFLTLGTNLSMAGTVINASGGGGSGTVTSFSANDCAPLFTTTEATITTTPVLSFVLSNAAAGTFLGNKTGAPAAPSYVTIAMANLTDGSSTLAAITANATAIASLDFTDISGAVTVAQLPPEIAFSDPGEGGFMIFDENQTKALALKTLPIQLAGDQSDWNPVSAGGVHWSYTTSADPGAFTIDVDPNGSDRTITGLSGGYVGRVARIRNSNTNVTSADVILANQNNGSSAANRFGMSVSQDMRVRPNQSVMIVYSSRSRWERLEGALVNTGVVAGQYSNFTVDSSGRLSAATNGPTVTTITSNATWSPSAAVDGALFEVTAQAANVTTINAPSGSPVNGQKLVMRLTGTAGRTITGWNAIYRASSDMPLPAALTTTKTLMLGFIYNTAGPKWDMLSMMDNF